jgi:hypothetical protein
MVCSTTMTQSKQRMTCSDVFDSITTHHLHTADSAYLAYVWVVMYQQQVMLLTEAQHILPKSLVSNCACGVVWVVEQQAAAARCCSRVNSAEVC